MYGNIKIIFIFVPGLRKQHHRPGGFRDTKRQRIMEQVTKFGMIYWSNVALRETLRAANAKDYILRRKVDRRFKEIANELVMGRGYVIATAFELEQKYPDLFNAGGVDLRKMIWAISFSKFRAGNKMCFVPIR